jgi:hypothetical protein
MAPFLQQLKRFINNKKSNKDTKQDSGTVVTPSSTHSSSLASSSITMDRDRRASKASSQSHTLTNTAVPASSSHHQQPQQPQQPQQKEQAHTTSTPVQNTLPEPTQNNNNNNNSNNNNTHATFGVNNTNATFGVNNNTNATFVNSNTEAATRMIDEENRQRTKLPVYPGLERFQLIEKMGE